jgi:hypothetical protein
MSETANGWSLAVLTITNVFHASSDTILSVYGGDWADVGAAYDQWRAKLRVFFAMGPDSAT